MKKLYLILLVLGLAAVLVPGNAGATTYYLNTAKGDDANTGTAKDAPWKSLNKINSSSFLPGDKILFKRNQTWTGRLVIRASGAKNLPIILDAYGKGNKPVIKGDNIHYAVLLDGSSFITIRNLNITNTQGQGLLIYEGQDNQRIKIISCDIHNSLNNGITVKDRGKVTIKNCHIYANGKNGICVYNSKDSANWSDIVGNNMKLVKNEINDNGRHGVYLAGHHAVVQYNNIYANGSENQSHNMYLIGDNSLIEGNIFRDAYMIGFRYEGSNMTFRYNFLKSNYKHNLCFWNDFPDVMSHNKVYYNIFFVEKISDPSNLTSMAIFVGKAGNAGIFDGIELYNNSIYAADDHAGGIWLEGCDHIQVKNNLLKIGNCCLIYKDTPAINIISDYNIFYSSEILPIYAGRKDVDFYDWQALGYDSHSLFIDPLLAGSPPITQEVDFTLAPNSPAIGAGIDLDLTRDYLGHPVSGNPDIGALQYQ